MARHNPEPWFRTERNGYFVTLNGVQHNLHTDDEAEAFRRWHELMARAPEPSNSPQATVVVLLALFLEWVEKHKKPSTYKWRSYYLNSFVRFLNGRHPQLRVADLKPFHVTRWLDKQTKWGVNSQRAAIATVKRAINWAVEEGYLDHSPLASLRKPAGQRRETILTDEQRQLIVNEASDENFRDYVTLVQETGVRPQEVRTVEARHVDLQNGLWVFPSSEHKTGEKTGQRKQYIPPNQRLTNGGRRNRFRWLHRAWLTLVFLTQQLRNVPQSLPHLMRKLRGLWPSKIDPAINAKAAWQELQAAIANLKATIDSSRRDFGDPMQLKSMLTNLQGSGNQLTTAGIDVHVCKLLEAFLAQQRELTETLHRVR